METEELAEIGRMARRIAGRRVRPNDGVDVDDLVQEVLTKYWRRVTQGDPPDHPAGWLKQTTRTTYLDLVEANERRPTSPDQRIPKRPRAASEWPVVAGLIDQAFGLVSPTDAELLRLKILDDLTNAEIAGRLGRTTGAIHKAVGRAAARLQSQLERPENAELNRELRLGFPRLYAATERRPQRARSAERV